MDHKSLLCQPGSGGVGTTGAMSGCISSQASEGVCHCATICTRFSGRLNPLTPQFLIKITLGVISQKSWGWRSQGSRGGGVCLSRVEDINLKPVISAARPGKMCRLSMASHGISIYKIIFDSPLIRFSLHRFHILSCDPENMFVKLSC